LIWFNQSASYGHSTRKWTGAIV